MNKITSLMLLFGNVSLVWATKDQSTSPNTSQNVSEQPVIVVTDQSVDIPAPLQSEAQRIRKWSGSATIATKQTWENQRATNIKDILDLIPGVFAQQRNGAESARISIRGSGLGRQFQGGGLLLLQDGIPLSAADGSFDFQAVDPWLIDYTTVYRGASGMNFGGATLGGVINLGTTLPSHSQNHLIRFAAGSYNTKRMMAEYNADLVNKNQALRIRASHFNQQGFRVQNQQNSKRFDLQYTNSNDSGVLHRWGAFHLNTYAELPSSLSKALITEDSTQSRGFNINGNFHRNLTLSRLSYEIQGSELSEHQWSSSFFITTKQLVNPVFTYINRDSDDAGVFLHWHNGHHSLSAYTHWGDQDELRRENESGLAGSIRLRREQSAHSTTASYQYERALFEHKTASKLNLQLGLQAVHAQRNINESWPLLILSKRSYSQLNPRAGIIYNPSENIQWFTNLSRSFEAPSFSELNNGNRPGINTPIKAQSADTIELGSRGFTGRINWEFTTYYSKVENEFIRFRFPDGITNTTNADKSIHWGIETGVKWNIRDSLLFAGDHLNLQTSYQYNQFKLDNDPTFGNNKIPGVPEHYLQSKLQYKHPTGWSFSPNIEWVPTAYYIDLANTYRTENYLLTGFSVNYKSTHGFEFYVDAKNLNNQTYISTSLPIPDAGGNDGNYFYSGEVRAFYLGIKWQFE